MKIIEPNVELWKQGDSEIDDIAHVAKCARICYRKEDGNDNALYDRLLKSKHWNVFRHESVYVITKVNIDLIPILTTFKECPYIKYKIYNEKYIYIATNRNFMLDLQIKGKTNDSYKYLYNFIQCHGVSPEHFADSVLGFNMMRYTFCIDTQISTSRELNRVSPNNITEQSTRYVYEDGTICRPYWMDKSIAKEVNNNLYPRNFESSDLENRKISKFITSCANSFKDYKILIDEFKMHRQDARGVLPIDTATRCAYTYSIDEWRSIIDLRYYGTTGKPHPNAKIIADMIRDELISLGYAFE